MNAPAPPLGLLAELTHRCPLGCPYCSNPVELERVAGELTTAEWRRILEQAAELGVLHVHFSGGEPLLRPDLADLVRVAESHGLYSNLITSGLKLDARRLEALALAGLQHVQLSFQDCEAAAADRVAGVPGSHARKLEAAALVKRAGLSLTVNIVLHRQNVARTGDLIAFAEGLGADRLELAHVQYHGWALRNVAALLPARDQPDRAEALVQAARARLGGAMPIDHVLPDILVGRPKACMQGWGRQFVVVTPSGRAMPCHHAHSLPDMTFPDVRQAGLAAIWHSSPAFLRFRGTDWMPEPCRSCPERETDWGGCRCQAFALTGDPAATDPACDLSPYHDRIWRLAGAPEDAFEYRRYRAANARP